MTPAAQAQPRPALTAATSTRALTLRAGCGPVACRVTVSVTIRARHRKTIKLRSVSSTLPAGVTRSLKLTLPPKQRAALRAARATLRYTITAVSPRRQPRDEIRDDQAAPLNGRGAGTRSTSGTSP